MAAGPFLRINTPADFWAYVDVRGPDECWPWTRSCAKEGYGQVKFEGENRGAHQVAFKLTHGHYPPDDTRHSCDFRPCCNPVHLLEGTRAENMTDAAERQRMPHGEANHFAKLTETDVRAIRADQRHKTLIAETYNIHVKHVERIRSRRSWRHLQ